MSERISEVQPENIPENDMPETCAESKPVEAEIPAAPTAEAAVQPEENIPLAWHRFLTRFYLWIAALYHLAQAALVFTGLSYHVASARDAVYAGLPKVQYLDWTYGALLAMGALLQLISSRKLAKKTQKAPAVLAWAYIILLAAQLIYGAGRYILTGLTPFTGSILGLSAAYLGMMIVNGSYYRKRKSIFNA